ncbi:MAG: phage virion morphogenesis protein [bacterium]
MISADLHGLKELGITLDKVQEAIDPERVLDEAGAVLLNRIRTRFLDEVDPDYEPWPQSKAASIRRAGGYTTRDSKRYYATGTLFETGALFHSIQLYKDEVGARRISTDVPYARYLQEGTATLPPRVFLGFGQQDAEIVEKLILKRIAEATGEKNG